MDWLETLGFQCRISTMPNISSLLKQEISRVARREIRAETTSTHKAVAGYRHQIADLKRRIAGLERQVKLLGKRAIRERDAAADEMDGSLNLRFRPEGLKKHRQRLGLSAQQAGKIMGVSALSVYKWEHGQTRPRAKQLEAIAALRKLGKREAASRLAGE